MFCSSVHSKVMLDQTNDKFQVIGSAPEKKKTFNVTFKDLTDTVINIQFTLLYVPVFVLYMYKKTTEKNVVTTEQNNAH